MGETQKKEKKKIGLTTKIFIALLAGAVFGIILCYAVPSGHIKDDIIVEGVLYVVGQGFIKLMKMLVVPLVFCSLVCGSMSIGDTKKLGTVGARTLIFYLATTALAVTVALSVGNLINPGVGLDMSTIKTNAASVETMKATSLTDTLLNIIPDNPINSLASGEMLQIIVFALIIGVILAKLGERAETVANFFSQFNDIMMEMTMMIMALAPIGVFCLISRTFANIGFSAFVPLAKYMIGVLIALAIQCFGVYQILLKIFTGLNPLKFIKKFFPVMAFAFSTATSNATIPLSIDTLSKKVGVSKKISSFTIPLGATINMDGTSIMQGVAVVFAAQAFGIHLSMTDYITVIGTATLASIGTAGVPSVGLVTLTMVFNSVGLGFAIYAVSGSSIEQSTWTQISTAKLGSSNSVQKGDAVAVLGKPFGYAGAVGFGTIANSRNELDADDGSYQLLCTDIGAAEDGTGVIVNLSGEVVGIIDQSISDNSSKRLVTGYGISGLKSEIELLSNGQAVPYVGIRGLDVTAEIEAQGIPNGVYVQTVEPDSPAMAAGIQSGDIITEAAGKKISSLAVYQSVMRDQKSGDPPYPELKSR